MKSKSHAEQPEHEKLHSMTALTLILGVGRERLTRALSDAGMPTNRKLTVAHAFAALSSKFQKQETLTRRQEAEAGTAEIAFAEKKGELVPKSAQRLFVADLTVEMRKLIQSKPQWKAKELLLELAKVKPEDGK